MGPTAKYVVVRRDGEEWQASVGRGWVTVGVPGRYSTPDGARAAALVACWLAHRAMYGSAGWRPWVVLPGLGEQTARVEPVPADADVLRRTAAIGREVAARRLGCEPRKLPDVKRKGFPDDLIDHLLGDGAAAELRAVARLCGWSLNPSRITMICVRWMRLIEALHQRDWQPMCASEVRRILLGR